MKRFYLGNFNLPADVIEGIQLINIGEFFIAHEVLENVWRDTPMPIRQLYQGLIQYSVARLHIHNNNRQGALKTLVRSTKNLKPFENFAVGINITALLATTQTLFERINKTTADSISAVAIGIPLIEIDS
jgi:uncharacterized protein